MPITEGIATARLWIRPYNPEQLGLLCARPDHAVSIDWAPGEQLWIVSHPSLRDRLPVGATVLAYAVLDEEGFSAITEKGAHLTGVGSITAPSISIIDADGELSDYVRTKLANGRGLRGSIATLYTVCDGETLDPTLHRRYTFQCEGHSSGGGRTKISLSDIQRELDTEILEPKSWNLLTSITATTTIIEVSIPDGEQVLATHGPNWRLDPGIDVGYAMINNAEVISFTEVLDRPGYKLLKVLKRGVFDTQAASVTVDQESEIDSRPKVTEFTYVEGEIADVLHMLWGGFDRDGESSVPSHWQAGVDYRWLSAGSLSDESLQLRVAYANTGRISFKKFIESQLFGISGGLFRTERDGRLSYTPFPAVLPDAGYTNTFDITNVDLSSVGALKHSGQEPWNPVTMSTERDPIAKTYRDIVVHADEEAIAIHGKGVAKAIKLDGFTSAFNTARQKRRTAQRIQDAKTWPDVQISFDALPHTRDVQVGTPVRVSLPIIRDDTSTANEPIELDRTMIVLGRSYQPITRKLSYTLWGSTGRASERAQGLAEFNIPDSAYKAGATDLTTLIPLSGGDTLTGTGHSIPVGSYYIDGDVFIDASFRCTFSTFGPKFSLRVIGQLVNASPNPFDGTGRGSHPGGLGERVGAPATNGSRGFMGGGLVASGGLRLKRMYQAADSNDGSNQDRGFVVVDQYDGLRGPLANYSVPALNLVLQDGQLRGLPADLSGSGGPGGRGIYQDQRTISPDSQPGASTYALTVRGRDGGRGGLGIEVWARGYSETAGAGWVVDGGDPEALDDAEHSQNVSAGNGGVGVAGAWILIDDAPLDPLYVIDPSHLSARSGSTFATTRLELDTVRVPINAPRRRPFYGSSSIPGGSPLAHGRVFASPVPEIVEPVTTGSEVDQFFQVVQSGRIKLHVSAARPSDSNEWDMWITPEQLDSASLTPIAEIRTSSGWRRFIWGGERFQYVYEARIAYTRQYGGTEVIYAAERPALAPAGTLWIDSRTGAEWILQDPPTPDILVRQLGVPVGDNLLNAISPAHSANAFFFTRDDDIQPINALDVIVEQIRRAFISIGSIEGEYVIPGQSGTEEQPPSGTPPMPINVTAFPDSPRSITIDWDLPADQTLVDRVEVTLAGVLIDAVTGGPYRITGLSPNTEYVPGVRTVFNGPPEVFSGISSVTLFTPSDSNTPDGDRGITLSSTGRTVSGIARQDNSTILIGTGRSIRLTLDDGWEVIASVGTGGAFTFNVPSSKDAQLNKNASLYTNNGDNSTKGLLIFTYELG